MSQVPYDSLARWKNTLCWVGFLASVALTLGAWWLHGRARQVYSPGPVAAVHASWEASCESCHAPGSPMTGASWVHGPTSAVQCATCHSGPSHHAHVKPDDTQSCSHCHRDHRGREVQLTRLPDTECTGCHGDLQTHRLTGMKSAYVQANKILRFETGAGEHPQFQLLARAAQDPGQLKFNHAVHMLPGMAKPGSARPWTLANLPAADRSRYRHDSQGDTDPVQLQCASCHAGDRIMKPIVFEQHCQACHPLTVELPLAGKKENATVAVPHRLQPDAVTRFLWGAVAERQFGDLVPAASDRARPQPGRTPAAGEIDVTIRQANAGLYRDRLTAAEAVMFRDKTTCGECHHYAGRRSDGVPERIVPTNVKSVWFEHARFDHQAHRAMQCKDCHAAATASAVASDLLLPGIENCRQCHGPLGKGTGVRSDCTECHRYHPR